MNLIDGIQAAAASADDSSRVTLAVVGGGSRAASFLRLLNDLENVFVSCVCAPTMSAATYRFATDFGLYATTHITEIFQVPGLDLIVDMSEDAQIRAQLELQRPRHIGLVSGAGSQLVWDLVVAKKQSEEQERLFVELQVAYDKIQSHERRLQSSKEALERANEELESRLAEIFFTHEFFKALTSYTRIDDVCSLIVDGCNGILGAEISCVYLFNRDDWTLELRACQGRPDSHFVGKVEVSRSILGHAFREGVVCEFDSDPQSGSSDWVVDRSEIVSQAAVPLRAGENVFGVMVVASATRRELSPAEMERFQVLGNQSSLSLQNALLHGELERLSVTDRLTELYNHGYFQQRLEEEFQRSDRFGHPMSLILLDIDDFKEFNDTWGHPRGDDVLRAVSAVICRNLRDIDIAARYGGEEFVVLLPETSLVGASAVAERIRAEVETLVFQPGDGAATGRTVSVGVSSYPAHARSALELLESADAAMYRAKRKGKNEVEAAGMR